MEHNKIYLSDKRVIHFVSDMVLSIDHFLAFHKSHISTPCHVNSSEWVIYEHEKCIFHASVRTDQLLKGFWIYTEKSVRLFGTMWFINRYRETLPDIVILFTARQEIFRQSKICECQVNLQQKNRHWSNRKTYIIRNCTDLVLMQNVG